MTKRSPLKLSFSQNVKSYFLRHFQTMVGALGRLYGNPVASCMTILVIGVALALPAVLQLVVNNGTQLGDRWENVYDLSVFMKDDTDLESVKEWADELLQNPAVAETRVVSATTALENFRQNPDFGATINTLEENPLPHLVVVRPEPEHTENQAIEALKAQLQAHTDANLVQSDGVWVQRFNRLVEIMRRSVASAFALLALAVLLIVGNTIRLDIENRRDEILITKLVGGSNGFIRRPFLYYGAWYGLAGGCCALIIVIAIVLLLRGPVMELAGLYASDFRLKSLNLTQSLGLLVVGTGLGWLGAWIAAQRHIRAIEPR